MIPDFFTNTPVDNHLFGWIIFFTILAIALVVISAKFRNLFENGRVKILKESEQKYTNIFDSSPIGIALISKDYKYIDVNETLCKMLGYEKDELMDKGFVSMTHADDLENNLQKVKALFQGDIDKIRIKKRYITKNGEVLWVDLKANLARDSEGRPQYCVSMLEDISKGEIVEQALKESEERYRILSDSSPQGIILYAQGRLVYINKAGLKILGAKSDVELMGKSLLDLVEPSHRKDLSEKMREIMETGQVGELTEEKFLKMNGKIVNVEVVGVPVEINKTQAFQVVFRDITKRKQNEKALLLNNRALDTINEGIIITDPSLKNNPTVYCNPVFSKITGYSEKETIGENLRILIGKNTSKIELEKIREAIDKGESYEGLLYNYKKNGKPFWNQLTIKPIQNEKGELTNFLGVIVDMTDQVQARDALHESREKWRSLIQNSPNTVLTIDRNHNIQFINIPSTKVETDSIVGTSVYDHQLPEYKDLVKKIFSKVFETGESEQYVSQGMNVNGELCWYSSTVGPIKKKGKVVNLVINATDITKQKEHEANLIKAKENAEETQRVKQELFANISHELRTPLNVIMGMSELFTESGLTTEQGEYLNAMKLSAQNLLVIISDILDVSRIEAKKMNFENVCFDLKKLTESIIDSFKFSTMEKGLDLELNVDHKISSHVMGDSFRLSQILKNLIGNAVKFTEHGGVSVSIRLLKKKAENLKLEFKVKDSGIGIRAEKLESIFDTFTQASLDTNRKFGGTGLGLSIVKKLVELQGGEIYVESTPGKGSCFTFILTLKEATENSTKEYLISKKNKRAKRKNLEGVSILMVDDNSMNRLIIKKLLGVRYGATVEAVESGKRAIEEVQNNNYDLILMDIQMPGMDGNETARCIRNEVKSDMSNAPIFALTAHASIFEKKKALESGMNDYIVKPFKPEELYSKIAKVIKNKT